MVEKIVMLAPVKSSGARSGRKRTGLLGVTIHNTDNWSNGAGAKNHGSYLQNSGSTKQASWHYAVDDTYIVQSIPEDEVAWHAGDGGGNGNYKTIAIEICVNPDSDLTKATDNAAELAADILKRHGLPASALYQHNNWSGKNCPSQIRVGKPYNWSTFCNKVAQYYNGGISVDVPSDNAETYELVVDCKVYMNAANAKNHKDPVKTYSAGTYYVFNKSDGMINVTKSKGSAGGWINPSDNKKAETPVEPNTPNTGSSFKHAVGETVRFTTCYTSSTNAAAIKNVIPASKMAKDTGKITRQLKVNGVSTYLLDGNMCWVNDGDIAEVVSGSTGSNSSKKSISELADEVIAGKWGNGSDRKNRLTAAGYDYNAVQAEVDRRYGVSSSPSKTIKEGGKVRLKTSATVYQGASKGVKIPSSVKGEIYTVQEISKDGKTLLLKEIVSWVLKSECEAV